MSFKEKIYFLFWRISGEDKQILDDTKIGIRNRFLLSGVIVLILFIISALSFHYSFNKLFHIPIFSWVVGIVFTLVVINIYRLNIITLAPKRLKYSLGYFVSLAIRTSFIILISLTVVKPLELMIFEKKINNEISTIKENEIAKFVNETANYYNEEICLVDQELNDLKEKLASNGVIDSHDKLNYLSNKLAFLKKDKDFQIHETTRILNDSPYFIKSIIMINKNHRLLWLLSVLLVLLFLTPFLLKFTASPSSYYNRKRLILQERIIEEEYGSYKKYYPIAFANSINKSLELIENYEDPPYNTIKKKDTRKIGTEADFINHLYGF